MDTVEAIVEVRSGVLTVVVVGAKAVSDVMPRCYSAVAVVDIYKDIVWYCDVPLFSSFDGCGHGIVHPNVRDDDHKREADGPGVVGCVVTVVCFIVMTLSLSNPLLFTFRSLPSLSFSFPLNTLLFVDCSFQ